MPKFDIFAQIVRTRTGARALARFTAPSQENSTIFTASFVRAAKRAKARAATSSTCRLRLPMNKKGCNDRWTLVKTVGGAVRFAPGESRFHDSGPLYQARFARRSAVLRAAAFTL